MDCSTAPVSGTGNAFVTPRQSDTASTTPAQSGVSSRQPYASDSDSGNGDVAVTHHAVFGGADGDVPCEPGSSALEYDLFGATVQVDVQLPTTTDGVSTAATVSEAGDTQSVQAAPAPMYSIRRTAHANNPNHTADGNGASTARRGVQHSRRAAARGQAASSGRRKKQPGSPSNRSRRSSHASRAQSAGGSSRGSTWVSPFHTKRTRSRLAPRETQGSRRLKMKWELADDSEPVLDDSLPGPAAYGAPKLPEAPGGRFNIGNSKSALEWAIYRATTIPGPKYYPKVSWDRGGTISKARPLTALEWEIRRSRSIPSPAAYPAPVLPSPSGGRFSTANPKSDVEWQIYRAKKIPGPGAHSPNDKTSSRFRRAPEPSFQSKVVRGNYQTHLSDAIMFIQTTINPHGPNHCRNTSAFAKQVDSTKKSQPAYGFSTRAEAESRALLREMMRKRKKRRSSRGTQNSRGGAAPSTSPTALEPGVSAVATAGCSTLLDAFSQEQMDPFYKYFGYKPGDRSEQPNRRPVFKSAYHRSRAAATGAATLRTTRSSPAVTGKRGASHESRRAKAIAGVDSSLSPRTARAMEMIGTVKPHSRPSMTLRDPEVPAPGAYSLDRHGAIGAQALSGTRNSAAASFGLSTRQSRWQVRFVTDPDVAM